MHTTAHTRTHTHTQPASATWQQSSAWQSRRARTWRVQRCVTDDHPVIGLCCCDRFGDELSFVIGQFRLENLDGVSLVLHHADTLSRSAAALVTCAQCGRSAYDAVRCSTAQLSHLDNCQSKFARHIIHGDIGRRLAARVLVHGELEGVLRPAHACSEQETHLTDMSDQHWRTSTCCETAPHAMAHGLCTDRMSSLPALNPSAANR